MNRKAEVSQELSDLLVEKISHYADFDSWLRDDDPENVAYAYDLIESLADVLARPLSLSNKQHRLETFWLDLRRDMAEEYAQAAAWDYERGFTHYADRRGF